MHLRGDLRVSRARLCRTEFEIEDLWNFQRDYAARRAVSRRLLLTVCCTAAGFADSRVSRRTLAQALILDVPHPRG